MKSKISAQKLRGGYYTPEEITKFLSSWAIKTNKDRILEPSCGDGNFLISVVEKLVSLQATTKDCSEQISAIELDRKEYNKAIKRLATKKIALKKGNAVNGDFFNYFKKIYKQGKKFDVVIGNPPFIRYQDFPEKHREVAFSQMNEFGFTPNRLTNIWVPFLSLSSMLLKPKGRLAMVIPAELFQVNYAGETRKFLSNFFSKINIITFKSLVFQGIQQEVVLLLAEKNSKSTGIRTLEIKNLDDFKKLTLSKVNKTKVKSIDHNKEKWIKYFLDEEEIDLLRKVAAMKKVKSLSNYLDVDVGVVTGKNDFFIFDDTLARQRKIKSYTKKVIARSNQLVGTTYDHKDFEKDLKEEKKVFLLDLHNSKKVESKPLLKYISYGESLGVNEGYKCRIRKVWYKVPSTHNADIFCLRQVHLHPKLIENKIISTCTDTIHRGKIKGNVNAGKLCTAFINSMTFAHSEISGRSYGGGVMTFEPTEIEKLIIPNQDCWDNLDGAWTDNEIRKGNIDSVLDYNDQLLLSEGLGLSKKEVNMLRMIWRKLRDRRLNRKG